jgi:hypothetical protein
MHRAGSTGSENHVGETPRESPLLSSGLRARRTSQAVSEPAGPSRHRAGIVGMTLPMPRPYTRVSMRPGAELATNAVFAARLGAAAELGSIVVELLTNDS